MALPLPVFRSNLLQKLQHHEEEYFKAQMALGGDWGLWQKQGLMFFVAVPKRGSTPRGGPWLQQGCSEPYLRDEKNMRVEHWFWALLLSFSLEQP